MEMITILITVTAVLWLGYTAVSSGAIKYTKRPPSKHTPNDTDIKIMGSLLLITDRLDAIQTDQVSNMELLHDSLMYQRKIIDNLTEVKDVKHDQSE